MSLLGECQREQAAGDAAAGNSEGSVGADLAVLLLPVFWVS